MVNSQNAVKTQSSNHNVIGLSCRVYLTANILVAAIFLFIDDRLAEAIQISLAVFGTALLFSIPAGFALYYCFKLTGAIAQNVFWRWGSFLLLLFIAATIPYLFFSGFLSGELVDEELLLVLYFSEGSAFAAALFNSIAIHRHFKSTTHENF